MPVGSSHPEYDASASAWSRARVVIDQGVLTTATRRGLRPTAIPDITARARTVFKLVNGAPRAFEVDGQTVRYGILTEFEKYAIERMAELSAFVQSGIIEHAPEFDDLAAAGGREVKMPFWKDLTAARQILSDSAPLVVNKITSDQDIARIHNDAQAWSANHLAKVVSGDDPMQAIIDLVGDYWARMDQTLVISSLKGLFGSGRWKNSGPTAVMSLARSSASSARRLFCSGHVVRDGILPEYQHEPGDVRTLSVGF